VVAAGAYDLSGLAGSAEVLRLLRNAYAESVKDTLIYALASVCIAFLCTLGIEHRNVKKSAKEREDVVARNDIEEAKERKEPDFRNCID
jgi:hypothetical protein